MRLRKSTAQILAAIATVIAVLLGWGTSALPAGAATLPPPNLPAGFTQTQLAHGLTKPIALAFAPSGDLYIAEQGGTILIDRNGTILPTPLVTVPNVYSQGECGLLGMAFDPNFAANGYLYLSYTASVTNSAGVTQPFAQLSRFTVTGDSVSPATEKVLYRGNQSQNLHHAGNDLKVGPDGKLWWAVADNVPAITNGETLGNPYGKMLRLNLDGSAPADDPFVNVPGAVKQIYSYGLRNPWRFTFLPDGRAMTIDTGSNYWEELDTLQPGGNFGWPVVEGDAGSNGFVNPAYAYGHAPVDGAASAVAAYSGPTFGAAYSHTVFVGDYNRQDIEAVTFDPTYTTETSQTVFDQAAGTIADLIEGPDGNLYFASIFEGTVNEISTTGAPGTAPAPYTPPQPVVGAPTATINAPASYNAGDTVSFSGTATDPTDGTLPPSAYTWQVDYYSNGVLRPVYNAEVPGPVSGPTSGATGASVTIPTDTSQTPGSSYRITLSVTDSTGSRTVVTKDLTPNLASISANTAVPGAGYFVDGTWHTGSYTAQGVVGVRHVLAGLPLAQSVAGSPYRFSGWSDGSALTDVVGTPAAGASWTAQFDPVGKTLPGGWSSTDVGAPITAGTTDYAAASGTFYTDGGGADVYAANDQFHYTYQSLVGDGTIVARVRYQSDSSDWAKAGLMVKQNTTAGSAFVDALVAPDVSATIPTINGTGCTPNGCNSPLPPTVYTTGHGVRMQYSGSHSITPAAALPGYSSPQKWLKLQRSGDTFTSWQSADGSSWTQIGIATVPMTGPVTIGLFDTSHNIGQVSSVAFDQVSVTGSSVTPPGPLPAPWTDGDVGSPTLTGSAGYANGSYTVQGAGADIWGTSDQFNYVSQPTSGDGTIVARLTSESNTSSNAKAGVIWKQSTAAGSPYLLIAQAPGGGVKVQYSFNGSVAGGTYAFPDVWMRIQRVGSTFTASLSADGTTWTQVLSKTVAITPTATVGLFECSHSATALGTATFDNVSYTAG
ncbi:PQQ-dependent sugar dehydrogenase [Streptacidiphilus sp. MAP12-16]|uniref:PQQ-dependent sugar dehydrogenase n=1 Tax=Streptacidiphilus sp. MAP12-16 TaxID=3156300 RepID=UPI0035146810